MSLLQRAREPVHFLGAPTRLKRWYLWASLPLWLPLYALAWAFKRVTDLFF